jgi:hypothetical protein
MRDDIVTRFTLLISEDSIDSAVDSRLREKIVALSRLMNDPGLVQVSLPETDEGHGEQPAFADDLAAITAHITTSRT